MLLVHGLESCESFYFVFFYYTNSYNTICTTQFVQHNSYCTNCIQIVYKLKRTNSLVFVRIHIKSYNLYTNCIVQIHTKFLFLFFLSLCKQAASARAASAQREGKARAASAQREPQGRSPSTPPAPTRPHPAAPTIRVHPAAPTS